MTAADVARRGEIAAQVRAMRVVLPTVPADQQDLLARIATKLANLVHAAERKGWTP